MATAVCDEGQHRHRHFVGCRIALWRLETDRVEEAVRGGVRLGLATVSSLTLSEYVLHVTIGIDELIVRDYAPVTFPGRTSPVSAVGLAVVGLAFLLSIVEFFSTSQIIFFLAAAAPISTLGGYLYNAPGLAPQTFSPIVSLHTAFCLLALCLGGLFLRPDKVRYA